ncbi:sacsin-like [Crassostrea angulata]|uniref:sacsin-like n=1 Tax=Magallana angulata TaxID=2784310 RepID=UPI0022B18FA9|nr:sacsin-like [Crassostrea angulata]XP_052698444.1 sacsin-like [Crassostrea angulata]
MADDVDSDSDDEIEYSGMIQPPLIKQLQTILSEYPDDGQILKEIIQNAEDAGASEMKILYDGRPAVQEPSTKKAPFRKYFKGPALLVHNNAEFSEDDWKGIKMLYSSIKEFDKTKVGRFGLGFKSVFHITDHPVIISGDQLLVLDPHQDSSKVCQTLKLKKLHKYKKFNVEDCLKAFSGVFGFDQNTIESGHFEGTIFRFPLRQEETKLSDNIYDKSKVDDLFMSFKDEAPVSLLFLKCLESITLLREESESKTGYIGEKIFSVCIDETTIEAVRSARKDMRSQIQGLGNTLPSDPIANSYNMKIYVEDDARNATCRSWKVMNLFQGENSMSSTLRKLSKDDSLSYSPYVGVAMDMDCPSNFQGHVFCFLPLPLTEKSLSGLPIHVNGFFALSQSRRFVKWPTADQIRNHTHTDKSIQWNQALVIEVLSEVYSSFLQELVQESSNYEDLSAHATTVSQCIPNTNEVDEHWRILIPPLVEKLKNTKIFFTTNKGGEWISKDQAVFLRPNKIPSGHGVESTIRRILEMYHQNTVEVDDHVWETMKLQGHTEVTPEFINRILRTSNAYTSCSNDDKFNLIRYLLKDGQYNSLEDLTLLPLQNGSYIKFTRSNINSCEIYMMSPSKMKLFVGMEDKLLQTLPTDVQSIFEKMIGRGTSQVQHLQEQSFVNLLEATIKRNIGGGQYPIEWRLAYSNVDFNWLRMVWECIVNDFTQKLERFQDLPLIPEKINVNEYQLHALRENMLIGRVSENISNCLDMLSIKVLGDVPRYISVHPQLNRFIPHVSVLNVYSAIQLIGQKSNWREIVQWFNNNSTANQKNEFLHFLCMERPTIGQNVIQILQTLKLFATQTKYVCIRENGNLLTKKLPMSYPTEVIQTLDRDIIYFAEKLGAHKLQDSDIFSNILTSVLSGYTYNEQQVRNIMKYIMENKIYELNYNLRQLVKKVPFVTTNTKDRRTVEELFDPEDELLQNLISDPSQFPSSNIQRREIKVLRELGLKSRKCVTTTDIYNAAKLVHENSVRHNASAEVKVKQTALFTILEEREELLQQTIPILDGAYLKSALSDLEIVQPLQTPTSLIPNLSWYRCNHAFCKPSEVYNGKYGDLIGYVAPVISPDTSPKLIQHFGWNRKPDLKMVLQQHSLYVDNYQEEYKSEYLLPIKRLYTYLSEFCASSMYVNISVDKMWMGEGFVEPNQICINQSSDDIEIKPYLVPLPKEFQTNGMKCLAEHLGCRKQQTTECLIFILHSLKCKYETYDASSNCILLDMDIIIRILNKLKNVPGIEGMDVPIPIHSADKSKLEFRAAKECNYCNAEWLKELAEEDGESMFFVHKDVSSDTAAKLGVPSLTENLLSETEGIQEWGQKEPLTRRIKNLLKDYKDGFVVPKELVQNADDAKATKVCFLYDERENMDCRTRLIDENMVSCQGPALWAFNDALFSQKDLENITKLSGATKADDLTKVGKFGLGFCSVYNLTDVPSFITGSNMVIFDPHAKYIGKAVKKNNPGLKIDLTATKNKILLRRMKNQFMPFNGLFGCNLNTEDPTFNGTLFRLPFRTKEQAVNSEISDKAYNEQEIESMIQLFVENAGNLLLFTQHVREIEFYHLPKTSCANYPVLLHRVCRKENSSEDAHILSTFGLSMKNCQRDLPQQVLQTSVVTIATELTQQCRRFCNSVSENSEAKWFISWASGTKKSLNMGKTMSHMGALPLASTAMYLKDDDGVLKFSSLKDTPTGFYKDSHIFCYLPLPVKSPLPVHVNGSFAVSSNRRQLSSRTTDDKNDFENDWNKALLADAVVNAYINLIENIGDNNIICEQYQDLWPILNQNAHNELYGAFYEMFYSSVIERDSRVFCGNQKWLPLSQCIFLDPDLQRSEIGEIASAATINYRENDQVSLIFLEQKIVDGYTKVCGTLPDKIKSNIITLENFYLDIFLENINDEFWSLDKIKALVGFALDKNNKKICLKMKEMKCIPTSPKGTLKMPKELVKRGEKVAALFNEEDERFPAEEFKNYRRQSVLQSMGMMTNEISEKLLIEQIESIVIVANSCSKCSIEKCTCILTYIQQSKELTPDAADQIKNISFLPTLQKPKDWLFPWFRDEINDSTFSTTCSEHSKEKSTCILAKPADLYMENCINLVGCQQRIIDLSSFKISLYPKNDLRRIGVNYVDQVSSSTVVQQLTNLCQNVDLTLLTDDSRLLLGNVCTEIYKYLDRACKDDLLPDIACLKDTPCLFINETFVKPNQTAFTIPVKCSPMLYEIDRIPWRRYDTFFNIIGVKKTFEEEDVVQVLTKMSDIHKGVLDDTSLDLACNLVKLLASVVKEPVNREKFQEIRIPDENKELSPIRMLCLDDSTLLRKGKSLKFINQKLSEADARTLGVQSRISGSLMQNYVKQLRPFGQKEELSDRIKRILQQYPLNESVLKEMLQNADDAKASEVMFITDFNTYSTEKTFDSTWHPLQGPALLVYNNSHFTDEDIAGIQHLGRGSKGDDPTKTGQYGVGFNAVYHITDVPSFLSKSPNGDKDTLCVMDPNCKYAPGANESSPGAQFNGLNDLRKSFPDAFSCYHENILLQSQGTVFRLPLRTKTFADQSEISNKVVTEQTLKNMLQDLKLEMTKSLLFLRNVRKIKIASIENGKLLEETFAELVISDEHQQEKSSFDEYVVEKAEQFQKKKEIFNTEQKEVQYKVTLKRKLEQDSHWFIIQTFGFKSQTDIPGSVKDALDDNNLGLLPQGGVAMPLDTCALKASAFCFLPLPCETGLTMHVNGHFSLDNETRRGLWKDDKKEYRTQWNNLLLCHVIAPIYAKALEALQKALGLDSTKRGAKYTMMDKIKQFHTFFPTIADASDHYWKEFVEAVYINIAEKQMKVFLSYRFIDGNQIEVLCYSLNEAYGNVLFQEKSEIKEQEKIITISKDLGAKVVDTPSSVCYSIEKAGIKITKFSPESLISYLKSPSCHIKSLIENGQLELEMSPLKTCDNVYTCIEYCMKSDNFSSDVDGLPLCLLETGNIVNFSLHSPVLLTSFSDLIPSSKQMLLHPDLHTLLQDKEIGCIEKLSIERLVQLLPYDINYDSYRHNICKWTPSQSDIPNESWLKTLWIFLRNEIGDVQDQIEIKRILHPILPWNVIPTTKLFLNDVQNELHPLEKANHVIDLSTFQPPLKLSLMKFNLPVLDNDSLPTNHPLRCLTAALDRFHDVLECLFVHRQLIDDNEQINIDDCDTILEYFAGGLKQLLEMPNGQVYLAMLRQLPLFMTIYGQKITLEENRHILALPVGLPADGMKVWAEKTGKILLHQNERLKCIFERFGVTKQSICEVYVELILPSFHKIPEEKRMIHIKYIRDTLLRHSLEYESEQKRLINVLKKVPFIRQSDGSYKLASCYLSPFNSFMTVMCEDQSRFPPEPFCSWDWKTFMTLVGMQTEVTADLFLEFALQQQSDGRHGLSDDLKEKSKCLVRYLLQSPQLHSSDFLQQVSKIKFIVPCEIKSAYTDICPHPTNETNYLIAFNGSIHSCYLVTAWTQHRVLPYWVNHIDSDLKLSKLGVKEPSAESIITHIQTVCRRLGELSEKSLQKIGVDQISQIMEKFYEYASDEKMTMKIQAFQNIPFVFLSDFPRLFPCTRFVLQLEEEYKMTPYLMPVPDKLFGFFKLFEHLGATRKVSPKTFANVLKQIHSNNDELDPNELKAAQKAMKLFFQSLDLSPENILGDDDLFFLSRSRKIVHAASLVYMDEKFLNDVIKDAENYFQVMSPIEDLDNEAIMNGIKRLPERVRPMFISDVVKKDIDLSEDKIVENDVSREINDFFKSNEFVNGVLRLVYLEKSKKTEKYPSDEEILIIKENLRTICFVFICEMKEIYSFQGRDILRRPCTVYFDCKEENKHCKCTIYSHLRDENDVEKVISNNLHKISRAIRKCTKCSFYHTSDYLHMICSRLNRRSNIETFLDEQYVPCLNTKHKENSNQLPKPGDILEIRWHGILDNAFISFEPGEYVAYISGMNDRGDVEYRYAIIQEKLPCPADANVLSLLQGYLVEYRPRQVREMKVYELYKFNRSKDPQNENDFEEFQVQIFHRPAGTENLNSGPMDGDTRTLEEIFREIREHLKHAFILPDDQRRTICRRIMFEWHPDKNPNDVQRATQVFQYIRKIIQMLEEGKNVDVDDTEEPTNSRHPWSEAFFRDFERFYSRNQGYARRSHRPRPTSSPGTDRYQRSQDTHPDPQPFTANRWLDEAKYDMRFALHSENTTDSYFSWICFTSYQAAEKAFTAWQYNEDAKKVNQSDSLPTLAQNCPEDLQRLARELQSLTQGSKRMRYPEGDRQPSKAYTRVQASKAIELANQIIDKVDECLAQ